MSHASGDIRKQTSGCDGVCMCVCMYAYQSFLKRLQLLLQADTHGKNPNACTKDASSPLVTENFYRLQMKRRQNAALRSCYILAPGP